MRFSVRPSSRLFFVFLGVVTMPALAWAHPGHEGHDVTWEFTGGLTHPWTGLDHLLAMVAVGCWTMQLQSRGRWAVPVAFLLALGVGSGIGATGVAFSGTEALIAASLLFLGWCVFAAKQLPVVAAASLAAGFAFFHGLAHGAEMPAGATGWGYGVGLLISSFALHAAGALLGLRVRHLPLHWQRGCGLLCAGAGAWLLLG